VLKPGVPELGGSDAQIHPAPNRQIRAKSCPEQHDFRAKDDKRSVETPVRYMAEILLENYHSGVASSSLHCSRRQPSSRGPERGTLSCVGGAAEC
jgi:hypothetical protein